MVGTKTVLERHNRDSQVNRNTKEPVGIRCLYSYFTLFIGISFSTSINHINHYYYDLTPYADHPFKKF